eukprot:gene11405-23858_t
MSGGHRFPYPKYVWSPAGGWWASPVNWKRNTLIYIGFMAVTCAFAANSAQSKTVKCSHKIYITSYEKIVSGRILSKRATQSGSASLNVSWADSAHFHDDTTTFLG